MLDLSKLPYDTDMFPSLLITQDKLIPQGSYAQSLAVYLKPDPKEAAELDHLLESKKIGLVAHFYMDPEIQGILNALKWKHLHIADSLKMGEEVVKMAQAGCLAIIVMGVDFMSENIRAMLDAAGFEKIPLYRLSKDPIGCSLAEAANQKEYAAYLLKASQIKPALHVIYINTGLEVKARAHNIIPTITCTSSNVVKVILQAFVQVPGLSIFFGPDTYMGGNLKTLFTYYASLSDGEIKKIHPEYNQNKMKALVQHFEFFKQGTCYVHEMFGKKLTQQIQNDYPDAFYTAHLEVPGEMFTLAFEAQKNNHGVVGSTSQILNFIVQKVDSALELVQPSESLKFILGTEAGMASAIVRDVQAELKNKRKASVPKIEIIFPVADEAIAQTDNNLSITPGVQSGDGCSVTGSCASCKFMKMNTLESLMGVIQKVGTEAEPILSHFRPKVLTGTLGGKPLVQLGTEPILAMRDFQKTGNLSTEIVSCLTQELTQHKQSVYF